MNIKDFWILNFLNIQINKNGKSKSINQSHPRIEPLEERTLPAMLSIANSSLTYLANTDLSNDIQVNYSSSTNLLTFNDSGKAIASAGLAASAGTNNFNFSTLTVLSPEVAALIPIEEYAGSQVLTLDYSSNVLDQITDYLSLQSPASIGVVRIIGHGSDGALFLGDQIINQQTLGQHSSQILDWKRAFTADADILLYGCSVASTSEGQAFVSQLADLTGTDVAASINITGSSRLGGDLSLEYATGPIEAATGRFSAAWNASGLTLASFTVSNIGDSGAGSLRQAIIDANNEVINPGADTIVFAANLTASAAATINLTTSPNGTSNPSAFVITSAITITGPTGSNGITLNNTFVNQRLFNVSKAGNLTLDSLTLSGGKAQGDSTESRSAGGIYNDGILTVTNSTISGNTASEDGGGIYNNGTLTVTNSTISDNTANRYGGGILNNGILTVSNSTFSGNTATNFGGGIFNFATLTVTNSTLSGNTTSGFGGGIYNSIGILTITNSTISGNTAGIGGGGIFNGATLNIANTIIANSTNSGDYESDSDSTIGTNTNNLVEDGTLPGTSEIIGDPLLAALANNGGPTLTMALGATSPAISTTPLTPFNLDQRGYIRTNNDIGAFAFGGTAPVLSAPAFTSANAVTFPNGINGSFQFTATGYPAPTFSVTTGTLPAGLTLSTSGLLSGFTTTTGTATLTVTATNGVGTAATQSFSITVNQAPIFSSANSASFSTGVAGSFTTAATGSPTYSIAQNTFFDSNFATLPTDWTLTGSAAVTGGACVLNPATALTKGALILPKLGASSPGSFTASFDFTVANSAAGAGVASSTSFNYGELNTSTGAIEAVTNGLVVTFTEATATVPAFISVSWNNAVIAKAPITFVAGAKPVVITLDGANFLTVSYNNNPLLNINLAGKVNAADRSNYQFGLSASNTTANPSSHTIDNLNIVSNGVLPTGLALDSATGIISGTPTTTSLAGTQVFNLIASNADGVTNQLFGLNLASGGPVFSSADTNVMLPGVATTFAIAAPGSAGPTTYSIAPQTLVTTTLANAGTLPAGASINGSARFNADALELTQNVASQTGTVQFLGQGAQNPDAFSASFSYKAGGGTTVGGNGISFNYGSPGDNTKGLRVEFTELTSGANTLMTVAAYAGNIQIGTATIANPFRNNYNFVPVTMTMSAEGRVQVRVNNVLAFDAGNYTNWQTTDKSLWAFSFTGTTGASNNNYHTIKNLVIGTNGVLPPGLSLDTTTGVISGKVGIGTSVDQYVNVTATNAAGRTMQLLKLDFTASNTLPGQRPGTGTSLGGASALGVTGEEFRNLSAFAALTADGSVKVWGNTANGGAQTSAPTGTGYTTITSNEKAFAALRSDGSIFSWGFSANGSTGEPTGTGYQMISATRNAFAAIKSDGSIVAWGNTANGGFFNATSTNSPTGTGYIRIFANGGGFAAQKIDGTIRTWGSTTSINNGSPAVSPTTVFGPRVTVNDYQSGASSFGAFGAISALGTISIWGSSLTGGTVGKPTATGQQEVVTTSRAFAAIDSNGFIKAWGGTLFGGTNAPSDSGYRQLYSNNAAFVAIRQDGSLAAWGASLNGGSGAPTGTGYVQVFSTENSFAALKADGSISVWGNTSEGNKTTAPAGTGYTNIFSSQGAFAASKADGSITVWGNTTMGGTNGPTGTGWTEITTSGTAFVARRSDGSLFSWGSSTTGGTGAPAGNNFLTVQSPTLAQPYLPLSAGATTSFVVNQTVQAQVFLGIQGDGLNFTITSGTLPVGMKLDAATGWIYGNPAEPGTFPLTIDATGAAGSITQNFTLKVESSLLPNQRQGSGAVYTIGSGTESPNGAAFAGLTANGGVYSWGSTSSGGSGAPTGTGYTQITASSNAYAALKYDGSITAWGDSRFGGVGAPTGSGYTKIYSTNFAFAALKADGSIFAWGNTSVGGSGFPTGTGHTKIYSTIYSFAAMKADGSITGWGSVVGTPTNSGYISIVPNAGAFAALKADGSITAWGDSTGGGSNAPTGTGYTKIFANNGSYAALKVDGSIAVWGNTNNGGGTNGPTGIGFVDVWSTANGFAAMKTDSSLVSWGATGTFDTSFPTDTGFTQVFSTGGSFAAIKADGSIVSWGAIDSGGTGAPNGTGFTTIYTNNNAFAALKADGSITVWGKATTGGFFSPTSTASPTGTGYTQIFSRTNAFAAMKADGTVKVWGSSSGGLQGASGQVVFASIENATAVVPARQFGVTGNLPGARLGTSLATQALSLNGVAGFQVGANTGLGLGSAITSGALPDGITLNVATGYLQGTATKVGTSNFTVSTYNGTGQSSQAYSLTVQAPSTTTAAPTFATTKAIGYANYAVGQAATYDLSATSTSPGTVNYALIAGALPPGMTLQTTGSVTGTPTTPGNYQFTLSASDSKGIAVQTFTIKISGDTPNQRPGQYSTIDSQSSGSQGLNESAFAALRPDGTITTWGDSTYGGAGATGVPTAAGYVLIAQTSRAFAALRYDGSVQSWGNSDYGGMGAPTGTGFTRLFSNGYAFGAIKPDGSIITWGENSSGGTGEPTGTGFTQIFTNSSAMVAMKSDGSLTAWGNTGTGGINAPTGTGYVTLTSNATAFAALKADGSITAWGNTTNGGQLPTLASNNSYTAVYSNPNGFAAVRADGTISTWGATFTGDKPFTGGSNFISVSATGSAFAGLKSDGTITAWGNSTMGANGPTETGFTAIYSTRSAFAALKVDGSIKVWGLGKTGGTTGAPTTTGWTQIYSTSSAFVAVRNDGTVRSWGSANGKAPTTTGFTQVFSTLTAFVGQKTDGSLVAWGSTAGGGLGAPTGTDLSVSSAQAAIPYQQYGTTGELPTAYLGTRIGAEGGAGPAAYQVGALSQGAYYSVTGDLPAGLTLNPATGFLSGTLAGLAGTYSFTITSTSVVGSVAQVYTLDVKDPLLVILPNQRVGSGAVSGVGSGQSASNKEAFAALKADGSISAWGNSDYGGSNAPAGTGFTQIFSTNYAFAALKADGSISAWGNSDYGGTGAPTGTGYTQLFSNNLAFTALKSDGSITAWGVATSGGTGAPAGTGFNQVFSTNSAFAALKADGSISAWGNSSDYGGGGGGTGAPTGTGFTRVFSTGLAFAAVKADGSISAWGNSDYGGSNAPTGTGFTQVFSSQQAFAAVKADGSISAWGNSSRGGTGAPTGTGYTQLFSTDAAFAALKSNGSISAWGIALNGGTGAPTGTGYTQLFSTGDAFAALKSNGSISAWGYDLFGGTGAPTGTGFTQVFSSAGAFAALKADGSITAWGYSDSGGTGAPAGTGFTQIYSNNSAFAALKADGSITAWGNSDYGGTGAPAGTGFVTVQSALVSDPVFAAFPASSALSAKTNQAYFANLGAQGVGARYEITVGALPAGITLNTTTGVLSGTPTVSGTFPFILSASTPAGTASQSFNMVVEGNIAPLFTSAANFTFTAGTAGTFTVNATGVPTAITYAVTVGTLPSGLTLNPTTGVLSGIPAAGTGGVVNLTITATNTSASTNQGFTLTVNQAPSITSPTSTTFETNTVGNFSFVASGYPLPTFTTNGPLPTGVTLSSAGVLSGTPAAGTGGVYSFTVVAANGIGNTSNQTFTLTVNSKPTFTSANSATFVSGQLGSFTVVATGFPTTVTYGLSLGSTLPAGLNLDSTTGVLSGTPTAAGGVYTVTLEATNGAGITTQSFTINIGGAPAFTNPASAGFVAGTAGSFPFTASGFPAPSFSVTSGTLPQGVTLNSTTGVLSGTPALGSNGVFNFTVTATNGLNPDDTQNFALTVGQAPAFTSAVNTTFTVGTAGTFTVTATGFPAPTFSITIGTLPNGLQLDPTTGVISGTPLANSGGETIVTITASNSVGTAATQSFTFNVNEQAAITSSNSTGFQTGSAGSFTVTANGFPASSFSTTSTLPTGVTLSSAGLLSGTPLQSGTFTLNIVATNGVGTNATQIFTLTVGDAPAFTSAASTTFAVGNQGSFTLTASGFPAPSFSTSSTLPSWLTLTNGVLSGTPPAGSGGTITLNLEASNSVGTPATQTFILTVNEAPAVSPTSASFAFTAGVSGGATTPATVTGYPTAFTWSTSSSLPSGLSLNSSTGVISGTAAAGTGGTYTVVLNVSNGVGSAATQTLTLTVNEAPAFTSANSTTFVSGTASNFNVTATSFPTLATFDLAPSSNLPTNVALASNGVLSITTTPVVGGIYTFTIRATNPSISTLFTDQTFTLTVNEAPAITNLTSTSFQVGVLATPFQFTTSGFPAASFSTTSVLPSGVTLSSTGVLGGTPASGTSGSYTISVSASNGVGAAATQTFTLTVGEPAAFTSVASTTFTVGNAGSFTLNASGFPAPTFTQTGILPGGVNFNNGVLSGTPSAGEGGVYNLTFTATNGVGTTATQSFTLTVNAPALITTTTIANGTFAEGVTGSTVQLTASGNPSTFTWATSSILPAGLSLSSSGLLSGTPQAGSAGNYSLIFNVSNGVGTPDSKTISLQVGQVPVITSTTSTNFDKGYTNSFQVVASGFPAPTFSTISTLPNGVTLSTSGLLSGIPTESGSFPITITASNNYGTPATQSFSLTVAPTVNTSTVVTSSNNPQVAGNSITYTATITPNRSGGNSVGGTVQFKQDGVNIGSVVTVSSGVATLSVTAPSAGSYSITAEYSGDSNYSTSTSQALTQVTTTLFATATSLTSNANPEIFGNSITLTATVTSGSGAPTGTVQFKDGATLIGSPITLVSGIATLSGVSLSAGSHSITAEYTDTAGTPTFASSTSAALTQLVNLAPSITSTNNATFQVGISGTPFSFTASGFPAPTFSVTSGTLPNGITLSSSGVLSGTPASGTAGQYTFTVTASNGVAPASAQSFTLTVNQPPIFTSDISTTFTKGTNGSFTVTASGFPAPTFLITSSALDGVSLDPTTGVLSFSSTSTLAGGTYNLIFTASNNFGSPQNTTQSFSFIVLESASITSTTVSDFTAGSGATSFQFVATGTPASFNWSTVSALPAGLTLSTSGLLSGTPAAGTGGTYSSINVSVSNGVGSPVSQSFTLTVNEVPVFTNANATTFTKGTLGSFQFVANGFPVASYSVTSGSLPTGLSLTSGGLLSGTPTAGTGSTPISLTIQASNTIGTVQTATQTFTLTVLEAASITSTTTAATFNAGSNTNSFTFQASGTPGTFNWTTSSVLPVGVTLNATSGELSGNPAAGTGGIYSINVNVSNGVGAVGTQAFALTVNEAPTFTSANSNTFVSGTASSFNVTATSFPTGATFALSPTSNPLPTGVGFASGVLSTTTTPVTGGVYTFTIRATNPSDGTLFTDQSFTLTVNKAASVAATAVSTFTATIPGGATTPPTVTGYPTAYNWTTLSTLPSGLSLDSNTGVISGTPTAGTGRIYTVVLNVSNGVGAAAMQTLTLTVNQESAFISVNATTFAVGTAANFSLSATGFPAPTFTQTGTLPTGVTFTNGVLSGIPLANQGGVYNLTFTATNGVGTAATQNFTLTVNEDASVAPTATSAFTATVPGGATTQPTVTGYPTTFNWTTSSNLPSGLSLNSSTGVISGTPAAGTGRIYTVVLNVSNGVGAAAVQTLTLTVNEAPTFTSANAATFISGTAGSFNFTATSFPTGATFDLAPSSNLLPTGVTLAPNGVLSITTTPVMGGVYSVTIRATNPSPSTLFTDQVFTLTVNESAVITSSAATTFTVGISGTSFQFTNTGYPAAASYSTASNLPQGLTLSSSGILSGNPALGTGGVYTLVINATNGVGVADSQTFTLTINEQPAFTSFATATFEVGTSGNFQLTASGQPTNITYTTSGNLPTGVTLSNSGLLSGIAAVTTGGIYNFTITATNGVGTPATQAFTLTVNEAASFTSATTTTFKTEVSRSFLFTAIGQPNVFTYALGSNSVNLPSGVTLSSSGVLSGIPAAGTGGLYAITVEVSNGIGAPASQTFNLVVEQPPAFTNANNTTFTGGNPSSFTLTSSGYPTNFNYTLISGTLPPGITLDPTTGLLSGTIPGNEQGVFDVVFGVGNAVTPDATQSFRFNVQPSGGLYMYDSVLKTLSISLANDVDLNFNETAGTFTFSMINPSGATPVFGPVTGSGILSGSGTSTITILAANLSGGVTLNNDNAVSQNTDNDLRFTAGTLNSALLKVELIGTGTVDFLQGTTTGITGGMSFTVNNTVTIEGNLTAGSGTFERDRSSYGVNLIGSTTSIDAVAFNNNKTVGLGDEVGDLLTFAGGLTTNAQIDTFAAGTIRTNSNLIQIDRLSLLANTVLDTRATGSGASILLNDPKQNGFTLITFTKVTDSVTLTGNVQLNDLMATVTGNLVMGNGVTPTTITVTTDGDVSALGGSVTFNSNTVIDTGAKNVTFVADTVDFNPAASFQGTGKIGFTPMTQGNNIYLGTAASTAQSGMKVNQDGIDTLSSKYQSVTFGSQGYNGIITVGETVVSNQINLINNGGGKIYVVGDLVVQGVSADGVGVFIIGSGSTTILNSDIITPGTAVLIQDAVQVDAPNVIIDTTNGGTLPLGANVTITGGTTGIFSTLGSSNNLTVTAGSQGDAFIGSLLGFGNAGGLGSFVNDLTITGNNIYITNANIINGALVLGDSGSNTQISLDGAVLNGLLPSTGYSKFTSSSVTLAGTLDVVNTNPSFDPQVGTRFSIFESTGTNKTSGGFLGMPQGTEFNVGPAKYAITYVGGTGYNDVQLVSINEVPTPTGPIITSPFSVDLNTIIATNSGVVTFTNMSGGLVRSFQPFVGYNGNITVSGVDQTGDGVPDALVVGKATLGDVSTVMVIDAATGRQTMLFDAFQPSFLGGVSLTSGLVNIGGQSQTVVVVGAGQGGGPHVKLYSTQNGQELSSFYAFSQTFAGGVNLAAADLNNDGYSEIVAGAGQGGGPEVRVFSGQNFSVIKAFMAYELNFSGGVYVAAGDLDSDNTQEIITGAAAGGGSRVIVWDYDTLAVENNFMAYGSIINSSGQVIDEFFSGGVRVGLGDINGDGLIDLVTGAGPSGGPNVKVFGGLQLDLLLSYFAGNPEDEDGVFVA